MAKGGFISLLALLQVPKLYGFHKRTHCGWNPLSASLSHTIRCCSMHSVRRAASEQQRNVTLMEYFVPTIPSLMQNHTIFISPNPVILTKTHKLMQNHQFHLSALQIICLYPVLAFVVVQPYYIFKTDSPKSHSKKYLDRKELSTRLIQLTTARTLWCRPALRTVPAHPSCHPARHVPASPWAACDFIFSCHCAIKAILALHQ